MKKFAAILLVLMIASAPLCAQGAPKKVLSQTKLDKFLADLPQIAKELERLGEKYDKDFGMDSPEMADALGTFTVPDFAAMFKALQADAQVKALLAKFGWRDDFWEVYGAVFGGYFLLVFEDAAIQTKSGEISKAVEKSKAAYNGEDFQLIKKNREKIEQVLESLE